MLYPSNSNELSYENIHLNSNEGINDIVDVKSVRAALQKLYFVEIIN